MKEKDHAKLSYSFTMRSISPSDAHPYSFSRFYKNSTAVISFVIFSLICLACVFAPLLTKWNYAEINMPDRLSLPSFSHILGTDRLGRDMFSRLLYGGRATLRIAFISTGAAAFIGGTLGLAAGYFKGWVDLIISPVLDILSAIPLILLALVIEGILGYGRGYFMYAIIIGAIPQFAHLARASTINVINRLYCEAARALGVSHLGIIRGHVLHHIAPLLVIRFASAVAESILTCTVFGYLDIGIRPPIPEWGNIVYSAKDAILTMPQLTIIPCAVIAVSVISVNLFSDGLRDALDFNHIM